MPYKLIDQIIREQEENRERQRKQVLFSLMEILSELSPKYGFTKARIFGSIVKPKRFQNRSDIDIAVFNLKDKFFFSLMAELSRSLERDVDLYQIETMGEYLRKKVEEEGILWIKQD